MSNIQVITSSQVAVYVTSTVNTFETQNRFAKDITIAGLKEKLEMVTGSSAGQMKIELRSSENQLICPLDNDEALLGSYPVEDNMKIHVIDKSMRTGEYEDVSKVEKFEITQSEYDKRTDSVKAFKERNKMGRFREVDPEEAKRQKEEKEKKEQEEKEKAEGMKVDNRCEVSVSGNPPRRGTVRYVGLTDFKPGYWIGVEYDEPYGKHDGSVGGKKYFDCKMKYGSFVKPANVEVGDFPEEELDLDEI